MKNPELCVKIFTNFLRKSKDAFSLWGSASFFIKCVVKPPALAVGSVKGAFMKKRVGDKKKVFVSPYIYDKDSTMELRDSDVVIDIAKMFRDHNYNDCDYRILECLYRYPFLNTKNIGRYICCKLGETSEMYIRNRIRKLRADGVVCTAIYHDKNLYYLSNCATSYFTNRKGFQKQPMIKQVDKSDKGAILECASLAQWHISLVTDGITRNSSFRQVRKFKCRAYLPSYVEYKKGDYMYHIFAFSAPKGEGGAKRLIREILDAWEMQTIAFKGKKNINLTVIVVSGIEEIEGIEAYMRKWKSSSGRTIYYAVESNCLDMSGLKSLYYYTTTFHSGIPREELKTICLK